MCRKCEGESKVVIFELLIYLQHLLLRLPIGPTTRLTVRKFFEIKSADVDLWPQPENPTPIKNIRSGIFSMRFPSVEEGGRGPVAARRSCSCDRCQSSDNLVGVADCKGAIWRGNWFEIGGDGPEDEDEARLEEEDALFKGFGLVLLSMEEGGVVAISPMLVQDEGGPRTAYQLVIRTEPPRLISELNTGASRHVNNTGCKSVGGRVQFAGTVISISEAGAAGGIPMPTSKPQWFDDTVVVAAGNIVASRVHRSGDGPAAAGGRPTRAGKGARMTTGKEYVIITAEQHGDILEALHDMDAH